ncbi:hypothetical protein C8Q76DRAFT_697826 [Earliella scabrosa]|nr:hypothetical protein C8Q76DRAFT_697826 [Earliella scabrosa]
MGSLLLLWLTAGFPSTLTSGQRNNIIPCTTITVSPSTMSLPQTLSSLIDRGRNFWRKLIGDDTLNTALAATITTLQAGGDLADLAPIPGLPVAVGLLAEILKKVQATRSNSEALIGLCQQVESVNTAVRGVANVVHERIDVLPVGAPERHAVKTTLNGDNESSLAARIGGLQKSLQEVVSEADALAKQSRLARFIRSDRVTDKIENMTKKINEARQNFQLQGGIAVESVTRATLRAVMSEADTRVLQGLQPLESAPYRAGNNEVKAQYLEGTRENVMKNLYAWAEESSNVGAEKRVLALIGHAGMGKSTIASEFCRHLESSTPRRLGASFFFTRGLQGPNSYRSFFNTIASQLATLQPDTFHDLIVSAARKHQNDGAGAVQQHMKLACEDLVLTPLRELAKSGSCPTIFVVVDALDECTAENIDPISDLLKLLLSCTTDPSSPLRLFLTSRPEPNTVREILDSHSAVSRRTFDDIGERKTINRDIEAVIHDRLSKDSMTQAWSDADPSIIERLVRWSEGIFVYASTAAEFLVSQSFGGTNNLNETLDLLSKSDDHSSGVVLERLDKLYLTVLDTAFPKTMSPTLRERIRLVLGYAAVWQRSSISALELETLTGVPCDNSRSILHQLRAVVKRDPKKPNQEFRIMHTTFRDFLLDSEKTKALPRPEFHVDAAQAHAALALGCMRLWLYYAEKYMPKLLEESPEMLELRKLEDWDLQHRLRVKLRGKKVDEPGHSVLALFYYVRDYCAYHRGLSTSVQSAEMIEMAERFDQIPTNVFRGFCWAMYAQFFQPRAERR